MVKIIRFFGVDIDVSIAHDEETEEMEIEVGMRLKSRKNWVGVYNPRHVRFCLPKTSEHKKRRKKLGRKKRCLKSAEEDDMEAKEEKLMIPSRLLQLIESRQGTTTKPPPIFWYQKRLTRSDLDKQENRLFVTTKGRERFNEFLREEEREIVNDGTAKGLRDIVYADALGESKYCSKRRLGLNLGISKGRWKHPVLQPISTRRLED